MGAYKDKISIITVVYNSAKTIEQTIQSVLSQTYKNIEYIIIDGLSTDGTTDIIEKYKDKISYYASEPDHGIYDAMNKGIAVASGDVIGIVNADDWYEAEAIENVMNCFAENSADIVYGEVRRVETDETISMTKKAGSLDDLWYFMSIWHPAVFVKRKVYQRLGGFSIDYEIAGEYEFLLRCYSNRIKFIYLDKVLTYFRSAGISNTKHMKCIKEVNQIALMYIERAPDPQRVMDENSYRIKEAVFKEKSDTDFCAVTDMLPWSKNEKIVVWGTGIWGRKIVSILKKSGRKVDFLVDNNPQKEGMYLLGTEIRNPHVLEENDVSIIIAIRRINQDIRKQLARLGVERGRYLFLEEWMTIVAETEE